MRWRLEKRRIGDRVRAGSAKKKPGARPGFDFFTNHVR